MPIDTRLQQELNSKKTTCKTVLSTHYQIDRATLNKWLILFCSDIFGDEKTIINRRKLTDLEVEKIKEKLGIQPQSFRKKDLVKIAGTDYKTIRENIQKFPLVYGMSKNEYRSLSKFPPKVAEHIIFCMG